MTPDKKHTRRWMRFCITLFFIFGVTVVKSWQFALFMGLICGGMDWALTEALKVMED